MVGGELQLRQVDSNGSASLAPNERGIVLTPPLQLTYATKYPLAVVDDSPPTVRTAFLADVVPPRPHVYQSLMFWDRIAVPIIPHPMMGGMTLGTCLAPEDRVLFDAGKLVAPIYQFSGIIEAMSSSGTSQQHTGPTAHLIATSRRRAFADLNVVERGRWTMSADDWGAARQAASQSVGGLTIQLTNAIPVVTDVDDVENYLRFLEDRADLRRRVVSSLEVMAVDIAQSADPREVLETYLSEIAIACNDLLRVTTEHRFRVTVGGYRLGWASDGRKAVESVVNATFGLAVGAVTGRLGAALLREIAAGVQSQITVTPGPSIMDRSVDDTPFVAVPQLQYNPNVRYGDFG